MSQQPTIEYKDKINVLFQRNQVLSPPTGTLPSHDNVKVNDAFKYSAITTNCTKPIDDRIILWRMPTSNEINRNNTKNICHEESRQKYERDSRNWKKDNDIFYCLEPKAEEMKATRLKTFISECITQHSADFNKYQSYIDGLQLSDDFDRTQELDVIKNALLFFEKITSHNVETKHAFRNIENDEWQKHKNDWMKRITEQNPFFSVFKAALEGEATGITTVQYIAHGCGNRVPSHSEDVLLNALNELDVGKKLWWMLPCEFSDDYRNKFNNKIKPFQKAIAKNVQSEPTIDGCTDPLLHKRWELNIIDYLYEDDTKYAYGFIQTEKDIVCTPPNHIHGVLTISPFSFCRAVNFVWNIHEWSKLSLPLIQQEKQLYDTWTQNGAKNKDIFELTQCGLCCFQSMKTVIARNMNKFEGVIFNVKTIKEKIFALPKRLSLDHSDFCLPFPTDINNGSNDVGVYDDNHRNVNHSNDDEKYPRGYNNCSETCESVNNQIKGHSVISLQNDDVNKKEKYRYNIRTEYDSDIGSYEYLEQIDQEL